MKKFFVVLFLLLAAPALAAVPDAISISFRKSVDWYTIGTSAAGCNVGGTTPASALIPPGTYRVYVMSEATAFCTAEDTVDCAGTPLDLLPGTQFDMKVSAAQAGTGTDRWHCRSAGGTGWISLRKTL